MHRFSQILLLSFHALVPLQADAAAAPETCPRAVPCDGSLSRPILFASVIGSKWNQFLIAPYIGDGAPADQTMWIDNLKLGTDRSNAAVSPQE